MIEPNKVQLGTGHDFFTKIIDKTENKIQHKIKEAKRGIEKQEKKNQKSAKDKPAEKQNPNINQRQFPEAQPTSTVPRTKKSPQTKAPSTTTSKTTINKTVDANGKVTYGKPASEAGSDTSQPPKVSFENKTTAPVANKALPKSGPRSKVFPGGVVKEQGQGKPVAGPRVARSTYSAPKGTTAIKNSSTIKPL